MIFCKKCNFEVDASMRHSLVNNCCPSCGSALLGDLHVRRMEILKQKVLSQRFSENLSADQIFDITLFMLSEFYPSVNDASEGAEEDASEIEEADGPESSVEQNEEQEDEYEMIRDEIRKEVMSNVEDELVDEDVDLKVARLKRIAKETKTRNTGASVRRVSD